MRFLLDEQLSPTLVHRLHELNHEAEHVAYIGLRGWDDHVLWRLAFERSAIVVTVNADDFLSLADTSDLHAGLIVIRDGQLTASEQREWLEAALRWIVEKSIDLTNRVLEMRSKTEIDVYDLPKEAH